MEKNCKQIELVVNGDPIAKKRPRFARRGKFVTTYNDQQTEEGKFLFEVRSQAGGDEIEFIDEPLRVEMEFYVKRPKGHYGSGKNAGNLKASAPKYPAKKPDIDNFIKFPLDVLNGEIWHDDSQIVEITAIKRYVDDNGRPHTKISVREVF